MYICTKPLNHHRCVRIKRDFILKSLQLFVIGRGYACTDDDPRVGRNDSKGKGHPLEDERRVEILQGKCEGLGHHHRYLRVTSASLRLRDARKSIILSLALCLSLLLSLWYLGRILRHPRDDFQPLLSTLPDLWSSISVTN